MYFLRIDCLLIIYIFIVNADFVLTLSPPLNDNKSADDFIPTIVSSSLIELPDNEHVNLMAINSRDYRINITKDISGKPWHDDRKEQYIIRCVRPTKCEKIHNNTCFGGKIPYKFTSIELSDFSSQELSVKKLNQLEALRNIPKCWAVIQPFLCSVYLPKCTRIKDKEYVYLPSYEMCQVTAEPCRILYNTDFFPSYLKCNEEVFPCKNCSNDVRDMKFTTVPSQCMTPLVSTDSSINHYSGIEGCGLQCKDPMYTDEEHESVHTLIFWGSIICFICNLFMIATFLIHDWKHSKHPAWNLFYISICFLCNWVGWILQFIPGHRENIVCRRDGTLRYSEPSAGENLACIIPFILIYYFLIAANVWFAIFTYAWYLQTKDRGNIRDRIDKESFYFHFIAWALPFILTVSIMVLSEVDGNSITGICFVGYRNRTIRSGFVIAPIAILSGFSVFFSFKGGFNLNCIKRSTNSSEESKKLSSHILGMGIRTMLVVFFVFAFFLFESYEVRNANIWTKSLNDFIICRIKESHLGDLSKCKQQNRPSVAVLQLRLLSLFCVNLVISSWCWTWPALKTWKRFLRKKIGYETSEDEKFTKPKHRIIADAYAKRMDDVISVSIQNSHTDPAGLNFDILNSGESETMGVTLTNYLQNLMNRRNAMTVNQIESMEQQNTNCPPYGSSFADNNSAMSFNVRHFSVESRRTSVDSQISQVSVKMSETNIKATLESHSKKHKSVNMKAKKHQRNYVYAKRTNRRASSSSMESQQITNQMRNIRYNCPENRIQFSVDQQIERRHAITGDQMNCHQMFKQNNVQIQQISDDDDRDDQSHNSNMPSNMLMPYGGGGGGGRDREMTDNPSNLHVSNGKKAVIEQVLKNLLKNSTENEKIEAFFNQYDSIDERDPNELYSDRLSDDITTSISSAADNDISQQNNASFSDQSINHLKTQSQNSKSSCDVGIQANDYDITSHAHHQQRHHQQQQQQQQQQRRSQHRNTDVAKYQTSNYQQTDNDDYTETHQLLPDKNKRDPPTIIRRDTLSGKHLSDSEKMEKLKKLLLPSN